ncbi:MAG: radical SAM protein, partial [Smithellaceae bacterium]|nr:radical SAM protein [Smithellaceae bacterium]
EGLTVPLVYNCGGYERPEIIAMLEGAVDIYLPDFKYGLEEAGRLASQVADYHLFALPAIREMVRQVGAGLSMEGGVATRGIIIRHLVLPGQVQNSIAVLKLMRDNLDPAVPLSLMSQYTPIPKLRSDARWGRRITKKEYDQVIDKALDLGFETIFTQEVDDRCLTPDFNADEPFVWDRGGSDG